MKACSFSLKINSHVKYSDVFYTHGFFKVKTAQLLNNWEHYIFISISNKYAQA